MFVIVPKQSQFRWVYDKILYSEIEIVVTTEILLEYEEQLALFYSEAFAEAILKVLLNLPNVIKVSPISFNWLLINQDPDGDKFVDAYVASNADYIITNDKHYDILKKIKFPLVECVKLKNFEV